MVIQHISFPLDSTEDLINQNQELLHQLGQLHTTLEECQLALSMQIDRSQAQERLLVQRGHDLTTHQHQLTQLLQELELSHQTNRRQQLFIETLTQELTACQSQIASLQPLSRGEKPHHSANLRNDWEDSRQAQLVLVSNHEYDENYKVGIGTPPIDPPKPWDPVFSLESPILEWSTSTDDGETDEAIQTFLDQLLQSDLESSCLEADDEDIYATYSHTPLPSSTLTLSDSHTELPMPVEMKSSMDSIHDYKGMEQLFKIQSLANNSHHQLDGDTCDGGLLTRACGVNSTANPVIVSETREQPATPSPLLYPNRSPQKRPSLAAVDLPTFPKKTIQ